MKRSTDNLLDQPHSWLEDQPHSLLDDQPRRAFPVSFLLFGAATGAAIYFSTQGDYGTASAIALMSVALRTGYRAGAATFLGLFAGGALAMVAAVPLGKAAAPLFASGFGTEGLTNRLLSVGAMGGVLILVAMLSVRYAVRQLIRQKPPLQFCDRWCGLACGGIQGALLVMIVAGGMIIIEPLARDELLIRSAADRSTSRVVSEQVVMVAEATRTGKLGPLVDAYNPFTRIGPLTFLQHAVEVLRCPDALHAVAEHPAMDAFYERPVVQRALVQLENADPELRNLLSSGERITPARLSSLMAHPAVLQLLDDREFTRELASVMRQIEPESLITTMASR